MLLHIPVGRNRGHAGRAPLLQGPRRPYRRHHQHRRFNHLPRVALRRSHQRRPGDRCCEYKGLHVADFVADHVCPGYVGGQDLSAAKEVGDYSGDSQVFFCRWF